MSESGSDKVSVTILRRPTRTVSSIPRDTPRDGGELQLGSKSVSIAMTSFLNEKTDSIDPPESAPPRRGILQRKKNLEPTDIPSQPSAVIETPLPPILELGCPVSDKAKFLKQFDLQPWEDDLGELLAQFITWPMDAGWQTLKHSDGRVYYSNSRSKIHSWNHPLLSVFQMIIAAYRLSNCKAPQAMQALYKSRRALIDSLRKWKRAQNYYYNEDTLERRGDSPHDELRWKVETLDSAISELWVICVIRTLSDHERHRGGDPISTWYTAEALAAAVELSGERAEPLQAVLKFPLPPPWVVEFLPGSLKPCFFNKTEKSTSTVHPMKNFFGKLAEAAGSTFELSKLKAEDDKFPASDERLLRLLAIRQVWLTTCFSRFPYGLLEILKWSPEFVEFDFNNFSEVTFSTIQKIAPKEQERPRSGVHTKVKRSVVTFSEFEQLPLRQRVVIKSSGYGQRKAEEKKEEDSVKAPVTKVDSVDMLTNLFKKDILLAMKSLSNEWGDITRESFLAYMQNLPKGLCLLDPVQMFESLDTLKTGMITRNDLVLADDHATKVAQRILAYAIATHVKLVAAKAIKSKYKRKAS